MTRTTTRMITIPMRKVMSNVVDPPPPPLTVRSSTTGMTDLLEQMDVDVEGPEAHCQQDQDHDRPHDRADQGRGPDCRAARVISRCAYDSFFTHGTLPLFH